MLVAIIAAAGTSERAGEDKALADLGGVPMVRWSAERLAREPRVGRLVVVCRDAAKTEVGVALRGLPKAWGFATGGAARADSVQAGLQAAADLRVAGGVDAVIVHDAARPFVDAPTIARVIDALERDAGAAAALPLADTLRRGDAQDWAGETIDRRDTWAMQTPQAFPCAVLAEALARAGDAVTDCAEAVLRCGGRVRLVRGHALNFKVTTAEDLAVARALADAGVVRFAGGR